MSRPDIWQVRNNMPFNIQSRCVDVQIGEFQMLNTLHSPCRQKMDVLPKGNLNPVREFLKNFIRKK